MKCVFVESAHNFAIQYHSSVAVMQADRQEWRIDSSEIGDNFRIFRPLVLGEDVAIFIPTDLSASQARQLIREFGDTHPEILPADFIQTAWERVRSQFSMP